ncbi:MAG: hypothetical protein FWF46_00440 [Oscillospiraceae bacterium]|nr:hypothetical protein [Oscillospiraceae bacterium]
MTRKIIVILSVLILIVVVVIAGIRYKADKVNYDFKVQSWVNTTGSDTYNSVIQITKVTKDTLNFVITTKYNKQAETFEGVAKITNNDTAELIDNDTHILFELDTTNNTLEFQTSGFENLGLSHAYYNVK